MSDIDEMEEHLKEIDADVVAAKECLYGTIGFHDSSFRKFKNQTPTLTFKKSLTLDDIRQWQPSTAPQDISNTVSVERRIVINCLKCDNCQAPLEEIENSGSFMAVIGGRLVCQYCAMAYLVDHNFVKYNLEELKISENYSDRITHFLSTKSFAKYIALPEIHQEVREVQDSPLTLTSVVVAYATEKDMLAVVQRFAKMMEHVFENYKVISHMGPIQLINFTKLSPIAHYAIVWYPHIQNEPEGVLFLHAADNDNLKHFMHPEIDRKKRVIIGEPAPTAEEPKDVEANSQPGS